MNGDATPDRLASVATSQPLLDDRDPALFPKLTDAQMELLAPSGEVRPTRAGQVLFRQGDSAYDVMVVLEGSVSVFVGSGEEERELVRQGPGDLMVELNLFTGQGTGASGIVREAGSVLAISGEAFRELVRRELAFGDFVLQTLFRRRQALERLELGIHIIGSRFDRDTQRLREFAVRNRLVHVWVDADDPRAVAWLAQAGIDETAEPVVLLETGRFLVNPSNEELAGSTGVRHGGPASDEGTYDLVVIGAGPAGLAASVYGAAGGLSTCLIDAVAVGGQAATSGRIENYLGFPAGVSGAELAERSLLQAEKFGVQITVPCRAIGLSERDGYHAIRVEGGQELLSGVVVLALGVQYRRLPIAGLAVYEGNGVVYAVDVARGELAPGQAAVVVGGANSAGQAALTLADQGHHVFLVVRAHSLATGMARYLRDRIARDPRVDVLLAHEVRAVAGDGLLEQVTVEDTSTGNRQTLHAGAMVVLIGAQPRTQWLAGEIDLDEDGFILTGPQLGTPRSPSASRGRRSGANRSWSKRADPASSRLATCAPDPPRWSPRPPATAGWPCVSRASTSPEPQRDDDRARPSQRARRSTPSRAQDSMTAAAAIGIADLHAGRPKDGQVRRGAREVLQQRRLPHTWLAPQQQRAALTLLDGCNHAIKQS